ncbi:hypothetical protein ACJX0J_029559, partial [Zea mays]
PATNCLIEGTNEDTEKLGLYRPIIPDGVSINKKRTEKAPRFLALFAFAWHGT